MTTALAFHRPAVAQTFKLLYTLNGTTDGGDANGAPVLLHGSLYGTTYLGGTHDRGTVYRFDLV